MQKFIRIYFLVELLMLLFVTFSYDRIGDDFHFQTGYLTVISGVFVGLVLSVMLVILRISDKISREFFFNNISLSIAGVLVPLVFTFWVLTLLH